MDNSANLWRRLAQAMALSYNKFCSGYTKVVDCFDFLTMVYASEGPFLFCILVNSSRIGSFGSSLMQPQIGLLKLGHFPS